jgi:hypothetical protein
MSQNDRADEVVESDELRVKQTDLGPVYKQYWEHARHAENQLWNYTRIWALILTAIATILGSPIPRNAKIAATSFGMILSFLGLLLVYALRVSYVAFTYKSEVVAVNEMGLHPEYTRYIRDWTSDDDSTEENGQIKSLFRLPLVKPIIEGLKRLTPGTELENKQDRLKKDKLLDMPDILKLAYITVIVVGVIILGLLLNQLVVGSVAAVVVLYLIIVYNRLAYISKEKSRISVSEPLDESKLNEKLKQD